MRTAEFVSPGHPDKICDQIADAIVDACLSEDPLSRVGIEVAGGHGQVAIFGEVTTNARPDYVLIARKTYEKIGYTDELRVTTRVVKQDHDIAAGVDRGGAGDQGCMIGYACADNEALLPQEYFSARQILEQLPAHFGPDAKCQVTLNKEGVLETLVLSAQEHTPSRVELERYAQRFGAKQLLVNPAGAFTSGGFAADSGVTGRKIVCDAYGPRVPVGGGAFSGKDPTKVDRSAAYMARRIAVDLLRQQGAREVLVRLAYAIGVAEPVMAEATITDQAGQLQLFDISHFDYDLRPAAIIERLDLRRPIYQQTARFGHFGRGFTWDC